MWSFWVYPATVLAYEGLVLPACRSGKVRGARQLANEVISGLGKRWLDAFVHIEDTEVHNKVTSSGESDHPSFTRRVIVLLKMAGRATGTTGAGRIWHLSTLSPPRGGAAPRRASRPGLPKGAPSGLKSATFRLAESSA